MYADYEFYRAEYGGERIPATAFPGLSARAGAYVDRLTFGRIQVIGSDSPDLTYRVRMAVCAVAELIAGEDERAGKTSETTASHSESYEDGSVSEQRRYAAVRDWLGNTGLMYRGY